VRETKGDGSSKERLAQVIAGMTIDSPRGPLRFDPRNHNPIQDLHMRTVRTGPLRHEVIDILREVRHPDGGCKL
jgi:hypothetical protein